MKSNKSLPMLNIKKSPVDERDYVAETIFSSAPVELPKAHDMREDLPDVRNQGSQGSCAGMTSACMKEWQENKDVGFKDYMSPQFVYNNRNNQETAGMYSRDVMKILNKIGIVTEKDYPYQTFTPITEDLKNKASKYRISGYATVNSIEGLKKALFKNGPCYFAVPVYNYGNRMWKPKQGESRLGGHAMTCVGWNESGFIIRNSWGMGWNGDGYTVFPYSDWGLHWEAWTTIDADSGSDIVQPLKKKKSFWQRIKDFFKGI
jgi:C1A family cysteine protease